MDPLDETIRAALTALEQTATPRGYFDELPSRIDRRLEGSMQTEQDRNAAAASHPPLAEGHDEDSGFHDIKQLAHTTRERARARNSSQHDIVQETLLTSSSSGLHAVALPDPT